MALNVDRLRAQIITAISKAPATFTIIRPVYADDGMGGKIFERDEPVFDVTCVFDNSSKQIVKKPRTDGGAADEKNGAYLIVVYDEEKQIMKDDYFEYEGSRYVVNDVSNVLALNIYYQVEVEKVLK